MICPKCGTQNLEGTRNCVRCGNDLIPNNESVNLSNQNNSQVLGVQSNNSYNELNNINSEQNNTILNNESISINNLNEVNNNTSINNLEELNNNVLINNSNELNSSSLNNNVNIEQNNLSLNNNNGLGNTGSFKENVKSKKFLLIIAIVVILAILLVVGFVIFKKSNSSIQNSELAKYSDSSSLIGVKKDGKYGYINMNGDFVVKPLYEEVLDYNDKYVVVKSSTSVTSDKSEVYQLIDFDGNVKMSSDSMYGFIYNEEYKTWLANGAIYDNNLKRITNDDIDVSLATTGFYSWTNKSKTEGGIIRADGKITFTYKFEDKNNTSIDVKAPISSDEEIKEKYCIVNILYDKYGVVNCNTGKIVYDFSSKKISAISNNIFDVYDGSYSNKVLTFYAQNDKIMYQSTYKNASIFYKSGYININDENGSLYYDTKNGEKLEKRPSVFDNLLGKSDKEEFSEFTGITEFSCDKGKVNLKKNDKELLSCEWSDFDYIDINLYKYLLSNNKNYILAIKDDKYYIVDIDKNKIISEFDTYYFDRDSSLFIFYIDSNSKKRVLYSWLNGNKIELSKESSYEKFSNYVTVTENGKTKYYNSNLKLIYTE